MAFVTADRVYDTSTSTGTGAIVVSGSSANGFRTFSAVMTTSDTCYYSIQHQTLNEWETGTATYSSANTLTRTAVASSSNAGAAVNFSAGTKDVSITFLASKSVQTNPSGQTINAGGGYTRTTFTASAGQTSFSATYTVNYVEVYVNGILLNASDYTATTGTTVVLASAASSGDLVDVIALNISFTSGVTVSGTPTSGQLASWTGATNVQGFAPSAIGDVPFSTDGTTFASTQKIVQGTSVSASGTSIDFTSIPSWVKRVTIMLDGISLSGSADLLVKLGTSSGVVSSGYVSGCTATTGASGNTSTSTAGFIIRLAAGTSVCYGIMTIALVNTNQFVSSHSARQTSTANAMGGGSVTLANTLDRVSITSTNGTDTFDAGTVNILYE